MAQAQHIQTPSHFRDPSLDELYIDHSTQTPKKASLGSWFSTTYKLLKTRIGLAFDRSTQKNLYTALVRAQLRRAGLSRFDLLKPETYSVAKYLYPDEEIMAAVCGKVNNTTGSSLLIVTDQRIMYLDQIPLFSSLDEFGYDTVTAISSKFGQWDARITLHTKTGDFTLHSINIGAAQHFIHTVEHYCLESAPGRVAVDNPLPDITDT